MVNKLIDLNTLLVKLRLNTLISTGIFLTISNIVIGFFSYGYQILVARLLIPGEYATFIAFISVSMIFLSPISFIFILFSRKVSELKARNNQSKIFDLYRQVSLIFICFGLILLIFFLIFNKNIFEYLKINSWSSIFIIWGYILFGAIGSINNSLLQGIERFRLLALTGLIAAILKISTGWIFLWLGLKANGALLGCIVPLIFLWLYGYIISGSLRETKKSSDIKVFAKNDFRLFFPVFIANTSFALLTQIDVILVNWYFDVESSSIYAAASTLCKSILYLSGGFVTALFPAVVKNQIIKASSSKILIQAVSVTIFFGLLTSALFYIFGNLIIHAVYGPSYAPAGKLLPIFSISMIPLALIMVAEHFLIAKGRVLFAWLTLLTIPIEFFLIEKFHSNLNEVVCVIGLTGFTLIAVGYGILFYEFKKR